MEDRVEPITTIDIVAKFSEEFASQFPGDEFDLNSFHDEDLGDVYSIVVIGEDPYDDNYTPFYTVEEFTKIMYTFNQTYEGYEFTDPGHIIEAIEKIAEEIMF